MASVEPYALADGTRRYLVQYRTPNRKLTKKRGFTTKKTAEKFAAEVELAKHAGTFVSPAAGKITVDEVYKLWLPSQDLLAARTKRTNLSTYRVHVKPTWGGWSINQITPPDVRSWVVALQDAGKKRDTIMRALHVLRSILDVAVESRRISVNPVQRISPKRELKTGRRYLTPAQVETLATTAGDDEQATLLYTLAYCGLRISELAALDVEDYSETTRRLNVTKSVKGDGTIGPTKTYESRRVPVPLFLREKIQQLTDGRGPHDPLFRSPEGHRIDVDNYRTRIFKPTVDAARTAWADEHDSEFPKINPHDLRHYCASAAIATNANPKKVQRLLGHQSAAVTMDVYSDLWPDDLDEVGDALDQLRNNARM